MLIENNETVLSDPVLIPIDFMIVAVLERNDKTIPLQPYEGRFALYNDEEVGAQGCQIE